MMQRAPEKEILDLCEKLDIGFVAYSPMASGFLSGKYNNNTEFKGNDVRTVITRFSKENMEANQPLLDLLNKFAVEKNATPAQVSLAWMLHKKDFIVPIPGMRKDERLAENFGAVNIELTNEEFSKIEEELDKIIIYGDRKDSEIAKLGTVKAVILS
jgi:aryl-alcohol dehydrogenase-like predicted oxidoreductase